MPRLICQTRPLIGRTFPIVKDLTTVGALASCDVQVLDGRAGPVHCQLRRTGALVILSDLGGPGGVRINGDPQADRLLAFGDRITIGDTTFTFEADPGERGLADLIPGYEVLAKLGEGGMGYVFKARHLADRKLVAIKVLAPRFAARPRQVEQFHREASLARTLDHPNVVGVSEVGTVGSIHYFAMELLDGETCSQRLMRNGTMSLTATLAIGRATAEALHHLHEHRLLHRDIKPDNLMLCRDGRLCVTDLGIAADVDQLATEGARGRIVGTPHYLAPEVAAGEDPDGRTDLYALGCTLFHLLAGHPPYADGDPATVIAAHVTQPIPTVSTLRPDVPFAVSAIIERLMAKRREDRFAHAGQVAALFAALERQEHVNPFADLGSNDPPTNATRRLKAQRSSNRTLWIIALCVAVAALAVLAKRMLG